jgi:octaprenyl-diphosphate synthase
MRCGSAAQAAVVRNAISAGGREDFGAVLEVIRASGALEYAREVAGREAAAARLALGPLPASEYKDSLLELASYSVTRRS